MPDKEDDDDILDGEEEQEKAPSKSRAGLLIIIIIGILIILVGAVVAFFLLKQLGQTGDGSEPASPRVEQRRLDAQPEVRGTPILYNVGDIYVNVRGTRSTRVLKLTPVLEVSEQRTKDELSDFESILKDRIATVARGMTFDELDGIQGPERLRQEIRDTLNRQLRNRLRGAIIAVHFDDFLIQ